MIIARVATISALLVLSTASVVPSGSLESKVTARRGTSIAEEMRQIWRNLGRKAHLHAKMYLGTRLEFVGKENGDQYGTLEFRCFMASFFPDLVNKMHLFSASEKELSECLITAVLDTNKADCFWEAVNACRSDLAVVVYMKNKILPVKMKSDVFTRDALIPPHLMTKENRDWIARASYKEILDLFPPHSPDEDLVGARIDAVFDKVGDRVNEPVWEGLNPALQAVITRAIPKTIESGGFGSLEFRSFVAITVPGMTSRMHLFDYIRDETRSESSVRENAAIKAIRSVMSDLQTAHCFMAVPGGETPACRSAFGLLAWTKYGCAPNGEKCNTADAEETPEEDENDLNDVSQCPSYDPADVHGGKARQEVPDVEEWLGEASLRDLLQLMPKIDENSNEGTDVPVGGFPHQAFVCLFMRLGQVIPYGPCRSWPGP